MARVIPQNPSDPFAPRVAGLYSTSSRPSTAFQTIANTAGAIKSIADSPLTSALIRGGQAIKHGIEDYGLAKAAERRMQYETGTGAQEWDEALEPYKPMQGLSLSGDQPQGLGLTLQDGTDWSAGDKKPQGWSSESRLGELQGVLGEDLAKRASMPSKPTAPSSELRMNDLQNVLGEDLAKRAAESGKPTTPVSPISPAAAAARRRLNDITVRGVFAPPYSGKLPDEEAFRLNDNEMPMAPMQSSMPMPELPSIRRIPSSNVPMGAEFGAKFGAVKPLSLRSEPMPEEPAPPPPPIAQETERDRALAMQAAEPVEPPTPLPTGMDRFNLPPELEEPQDPLRVPEFTPGPRLADMLPKRTGMLAEATDDQLQAVMKRLGAEPPSQERDARLARIEREMQYREDAKTIEDRPLSQAELFDLARNARTPEQQGAVLRAMERTRVPISSFDDLIGNAPQQKLLENVKALFPSVGQMETEADRELKEARADYYRGGGDYRRSQAFGVRTEAPARAEKMGAEGRRAQAQGQTEEDKGGMLRSVEELNLEKAADLRATRDARLKNLDAKNKNLLTANDKLRAAMAQVKAARGRGGSRDDLLKRLKELDLARKTQAGFAKESNELTKSALTAAKEAADDERAAQARAEAIPDAGPEIPPPPPKASERELAVYEAKVADRLKRAGAKEAAMKAAMAAAERKKLADEAIAVALAEQKAAASVGKQYDSLVNELRTRAEKSAGVKAPSAAPAPATRPPPAPPAPAAPVPARQEGAEWSAKGYRFKMVGGKPKVIGRE